ncbi:hypothetical protein [Streptomyces sp. SP17KL33]|uniref:hypothetical protein n=1 Tax=Streptomyces sp. SP17KL33 TaxID=3002534 RepID=UPI003FCCA610
MGFAAPPLLPRAACRGAALTAYHLLMPTEHTHEGLLGLDLVGLSDSRRSWRTNGRTSRAATIW